MSEKSTTEISPVKENLFFGLLKFVTEFYHTDLVKFHEEHDELFKMAKKTSDYGPVAAHFYSVMAGLIETYYSGSFHFVPPEFKGQTRHQSEQFLHQTISRLLKHEIGKVCLDIGAGIGGSMANITRYSGGQVAGITVGLNEVTRGNQLFKSKGLDSQCHIFHGDCRNIPFEDEKFDSAYEIYALKYFPDLKPVFDQVHRVLKPHGLFLIYDLVKTEQYDPENSEHKELIETLEYCCGMPPLHSTLDLVEAAKQFGLKVRLLGCIHIMHAFTFTVHSLIFSVFRDNQN